MPNPLWRTLGDRIADLRHLVCLPIKLGHWKRILLATKTRTPLPYDEYEDASEIPTIKVNRIRATLLQLAQIEDPQERLRISLLNQIFNHIRNWQESSFRRGFIGKSDAGQQRCFRLDFEGEAVNDYGGPYRAVFESIVDELQCDTLTADQTCILPLFLPCLNRQNNEGDNRDTYILNPAANDPEKLEILR